MDKYLDDLLIGDGDLFKGDFNFMVFLVWGLEVIQVFMLQWFLLFILQISQKIGILCVVVCCCLYILSKLGFVYVEDGKNFQLWLWILVLGYVWLVLMLLVCLVQLVLWYLSEMFNEFCFIVIFDGDDILYIVCVFSLWIMIIDLDIGSCFLVWVILMGWVLLSYQLEEKFNDMLVWVIMICYILQMVDLVVKLCVELKWVYQQGYVFNDQELEMGLCFFVVLLFNVQGQVQVVFNVGVYVGQMMVCEMIECVLLEL